MDAVLTAEARTDLRALLRHWLAAISGKLLAHEFALFRLDRQPLEARIGLMSGEGEDDGLYRAFVGHLRGGDWSAVAAAYPEWDRLRSVVVTRWRERSWELLSRLRGDGDAIRERLLGGRDPGRVARILPLSDDRHDGGGTVLELRFEDGERLVYKPRTVGLERWFGVLLARLEDPARGLSGLGVPQILDHGAYGWVEYVDHEPCRTVDGVERFFVRAGALLAVFHGLGSIDCHLENLIAHGDRPVLVDAETVLQPDVEASVSTERSRSGDPAGVLETGFLPNPVGGGDADQSGIDGGRIASRIDDVLTFRETGSDGMALRPMSVEVTQARNGVRLGETRIDPRAHLGALEEGFQRMYDRLMDVRLSLLASPLWRGGRRHPVRYLARSTRTYWLLALSSLEPRFLADPAARRRELNRLRAPLHEPGASPWLESLIQAEVQAVADLDVPSFRSTADSRALALGKDPAVRLFRESPLDRAERRLRSLGPGDRRRQLEAIRDALSPS